MGIIRCEDKVKLVFDGVEKELEVVRRYVDTDGFVMMDYIKMDEGFYSVSYSEFDNEVIVEEVEEGEIW
jgi:hypothetical protein